MVYMKTVQGFDRSSSGNVREVHGLLIYQFKKKIIKFIDYLFGPKKFQEFY